MAPTWRALEADPEILHKYSKELGGPTDKIKFVDVFDPSTLEHTKVLGLLFVFPTTLKLQKEDNKGGDEIRDKFWFTKQTVENACGTVALLHLFCNLDHGEYPLSGALQTFYEECQEKDPGERAKALEVAEPIATAHQKAETEGQSRSAEHVEEHYITILPYFDADGKLEKIVELDGRKTGPVCNDVPAEFSRSFIKAAFQHVTDKYFNADPQEYRFSIIAVVDRSLCF